MVVTRGKLFGPIRRMEDGGSIFKEERALYPEFLPQKLIHRESEVEFLVDCIRPILTRSKPGNVFVYGPPGVGKTVVTKTILEELKENSDVVSVYINCWQQDTRHAILTQLSYQLGSFAPRRGTATDEVYEKFLEGARKNKRDILVVLDEIDKLLIKDGSQALYDILRLDVPEVVTGIILISNDPYALRRLDERTKSSLAPREIEFKTYGFEEIKDILEARAKLAFVPDSLEKGTLSAIARFVVDSGGDIRQGLDCLLKAGQYADSFSNKITPAHVKKQVLNVQNVKLRKMLQGMSDEHKLLLHTIAESTTEETGIMTGKLFKAYQARGGSMASRTFRKYITDLQDLGFLKTRLTGMGTRGKSRNISLKFEKDAVLKLIGELEKR